MTWKIPLFKIFWDDEDVKAVTEAITAGMNWAVGPNIGRFEELISDYVGTEYAVAFNSGTSALHAALLAYGIQHGDEVIVPSFTFIATANAPLFVGAKPVFADIEEETYGLDPEDVKEKITGKTKAIMPIHYGGCSCKLRELKEIADDHDLILIEDAAESLGAKVGDEMAGTFGDAAMFSFCQNKLVTTGEGGVILTDSKKIANKLRLFRSHGRLETSDYFSSPDSLDYVTLGYNFRMSNITAALGISQLKKVNEIIERRRENAKFMSAKLSKLDYVTTPKPPNEYFHVYQMYTVRAKNRDGLINYLAKNGILTKVYFHPVHLTKFYTDVLGYSSKLETTERIAKEVVTLPMYPALTKEEIDLIVSEVKKFYGDVK
ncbi:MAG: DegT/DnrJ/EryC1/StrS family aminotransferase [Methanomicrobia archaeon]|nr:DegT/DnrJ/EryC1/StrS family aminotransferase [Methanomicrobia archaeon]